MSRQSDKLNIIDQSTYQSRKKDNGDSTPKIPRSAKYKNKHRKEQKCTLFDFVVEPRQKQKQKQINKRRLPHLNIARKAVIFPIKRKGKTRLQPKVRVTRIKRIIKNQRKWKQLAKEDTKCTQSLLQGLELADMGAQPKCEACEGNKLVEPLSQEIENISLIKLESSTSQVTMDFRDLSLNKAGDGKPFSKSYQLHSRRFRSYCDNCTSASLKELTTQLLNNLDRFQKRAYANNEIKARAHPRLIVGFREALSRLRINKVKLLLVATDCEACPGEGGLDDTVEQLKTACQQQKVPYCFSLMRRELSYAIQKRAQISCVSVLDYDGANDIYKQLLQELEEMRIKYKSLSAL